MIQVDALLSLLGNFLYLQEIDRESKRESKRERERERGKWKKLNGLLWPRQRKIEEADSLFLQFLFTRYSVDV